MTIQIGVRGGKLLTKSGETEIENSGNLIRELNLWLNNGYELVGIVDGIYNLIEDKEQLCFIEYHDYAKDYHYYEVATHATAYLFRLYYNGSLNNVKLFGPCNTPGIGLNGEIEEMELNPSFINIIDLRKKSEECINLFRLLEKRTNIFLKDAILEDLSNQ